MSPTIYTASKTRHRQRWIDLRARGLDVIATWIDEPYWTEDGKIVSLDETGKRALWDACQREASYAHMLTLYAEEGDILQGALIEAGCALGNGKPVYQIGTCKSLRAS